MVAALIAALALCALAACGSPAPGPRADNAAREFAARAYAPAEQLVVSHQAMQWLLGGEAVPLVLSLPQRAGTLPLVVYLPGLGESGEAGRPWRQAWAAAGHAVLSVQALEEDAKAWSSELARAGEFKALGRARHAGPAMQQRLQRLAQVLGEAHRRAMAGEAPWAQVDWQRVAVAGFDLGAHTALVLAGEQMAGVDAGTARWPVPLRGVIALSPHASVAAGALDTRFGAITLPVLSITSEADSDVMGLVENPLLRQAPFERMPAPDKLLLVLQGLPHAMIGGGPLPPGMLGVGAREQPTTDRDDTDDAGPGRQRGSEGGTGGGNRRRGGGGGGSGGGGAGGGGGTVEPQRQARGNAGAPAAAAASAATSRQMAQAALQAVSLAYLDATLKEDSLAREWLARDAARWLGHVGSLRRASPGR